MPKNKRKIAFIDFCGTMIPFQSADAFVRYSIDHCGKSSVKLRYNLIRILNKLYILWILDHITNNSSRNKFRLLRCLKGMPKEQIMNLAKEFYYKRIKPALIPEMVNELSNLRQDDYELWFVSGAYDVYLKLVAQELGIAEPNIICSTLLFQDGIFTGQLNGNDCMGENKVIMLQNRFDKSTIQSIAYSDSDSDLPLLQYADRGIVVVPKPTWAKKYNFTEFNY